MTQWSKVQGKGFFRLFLGWIGWMMNKASCDALRLELNSLRDYCERPISVDTV